MRTPAILLAAGLCACGPVEFNYAQQNAKATGEILCNGPGDPTCPPECRRDLSHVTTPVTAIKLPASTGGLWLGPPIFAKQTIMVNSDWPEWKRTQAVHHEKCHAELYRLRGDHRFHQ